MNAKTKEEAMELFEYTVFSRFKSRHDRGAYYRKTGNQKAYRAAQKENAEFIRDMIRWIRNDKDTQKKRAAETRED